MKGLGTSASLSLFLLLAFALTGVAMAASPGPVAGAGLVLEKDLAKQTVVLDGQIELHLTPETRIVDAKGKRIGLAELPTAPRMGPFYEITGEATVRYEAVVERGKLIASWIEVQGETIQ